ncbi:MAG: efflux RND transporter periplasmic adaptor subunit [Oleispira sp.]
MTAKKLVFLWTLVAGLSACDAEKPATADAIRPVKAMKIGFVEQVGNKRFPGIARATQEAELSFRVPGSLQRMPVNIGQEVKVGDVLATLDQRDFELRVDNAKASLANAGAQLKNAKIEYDRVLSIQKTDAGAVSQSLVDVRSAAYDSAKANYDSSITNLKAADDQLSYATLRAPFDGIIVQRYSENFQDVAANNPVFRLVDMSKIEMDISIPENLISKLPDVKNPRVLFDAFPGIVIPAKIKEISHEASQATRTYNIRLIMQPPAGIKILPGMSGSATGDVISSTQANHVAVVPLSAVFSSDDSKITYVWKYNPDVQLVNKIAVEKGVMTNQGLVINKGIEIGDWIVTAGVNFLTEGKKVRLLNNSEDKR